MSLTTYQSKFVLVGGHDRSTNKVTNSLYTSTTGQQWESSLPPMPTKRSRTSSVSTRSPELLVVAGGTSLNVEALLHVVEVLQEDKWTTVDPLPSPAFRMHSILHDGKLHFMGGEGQGTTVYTCSCSSLISSATESTSTTRDSPLWRQYQAPDKRTIPVSCFSRLANIDCQGIVRGYCNISQSWVEATSTGDNPRDSPCNVAATVLTTGDIVFCHEFGGVYRGSLLGEKTTLFPSVCNTCNFVCVLLYDQMP